MFITPVARISTFVAKDGRPLPKHLVTLSTFIPQEIFGRLICAWVKINCKHMDFKQNKIDACTQKGEYVNLYKFESKKKT